MTSMANISDAVIAAARQAAAATAAQGGQAAGQRAEHGSQTAGGGWTSVGQADPVDVEAALQAKLREKGNPDLNWRTSIVDLMKLLDLDPSLDNRKALATELGYTGAKDGSAEMNIWLHRQVMTRLEQMGGKVPEDLKA